MTRFWAWFILAPLITVMFACAVTVSIALLKADDIVSDDYYQEGRMINRDFAAEKYARILNIQADVQFDWFSGQVWVQLNRDSYHDARLLLQFSHQNEKVLQFNLKLKHAHLVTELSHWTTCRRKKKRKRRKNRF